MTGPSLIASQRRVCANARTLSVARCTHTSCIFSLCLFFFTFIFYSAILVTGSFFSVNCEFAQCIHCCITIICASVMLACKVSDHFCRSALPSCAMFLVSVSFCFFNSRFPILRCFLWTVSAARFNAFHGQCFDQPSVKCKRAERSEAFRTSVSIIFWQPMLFCSFEYVCSFVVSGWMLLKANSLFYFTWL